MEILLIVIIILLLIEPFIIKAFIKKSYNNENLNNEIKSVKTDVENSNSLLRKELGESVNISIKTLGGILSENQKDYADTQLTNIKLNGENTLRQMKSIHDAMASQMRQMNSTIEERLKTTAVENENKLESIRKTVEQKLTYIQEDNNKKLDEMRNVVDEKLQKTLEERISKSFELVNTQLEQVYKGLGEMRSLATGVGDLKKVLSNVKTRGILGEIQLGAILEEIMSPEQYEVNVVTKKGSKNPVEYAIKLPSDDGKGVYLPIDSKFPSDAYVNLTDAYETGDKSQINEAAKLLTLRIKSFAKDISEKYIDPPYTTDFAIMFLPFEGLYAEVVKMGLVEDLQRMYKINIAGPSTMAALLNSLQMGFRTFAIQKRSSEVWEVLGAVKTEFNKFGDVLEKTQKRLEEANSELDKLVGVRTRQIQRKLKSVESLSTDMSERMFIDVSKDIISDEEKEY